MKAMMRIASLCLVAVVLVACGSTSAGVTEEPTPTPLPPDPALERPTYTVERGPIQRVLRINARVSPVDEANLYFARDGRVSVLNVERDQPVVAGEVLAELEQQEALDELRQAEKALTAAQRDLESAQKERELNLEARRLAVTEAQEDLARLLGGPTTEKLEEAQRAVREAERALAQARKSGSEGKTNAEYQLIIVTEALQDTQTAYSKAFWDWDWVQKYGTDPRQPYIEDPPGSGIRKPNKLTPEQIEAYQRTFVQAERTLRDQERALAQQVRAVEQARDDEVVGNQEAEENLARAQRELQALLSVDLNSPEVVEAQRALRQAELELQAEEERTFESQLDALENAQLQLQRAQEKVEQGRIIAPRDGVVLSIDISVGDTAEPFTPVITVADPAQLEVAAELGASQMQELAEGQPVTISLLARPDIAMPGQIRRLPAPYGSGGSGVVRDQDPTTRFTIVDTVGQTVEAGDPVRVEIVLERKENVLLLPPDAIRSFEGRRFVNVVEDGRERRVQVRIGIETEDVVEIIEGLEEGMTVVAP